MKKFLSARWVMVIIATLLAVAMTAFAAGCGDGDETTAGTTAATPPANTGGATTAATSAGTTAATTGGDTAATTSGGGEGKTVKIVSDLPLQGASAAETNQLVKGIQAYIDSVDSKAGNYTIEYESNDDSTAAKGGWDEATCQANATRYAGDESIVGVIGTYNSGCAKIEIPILNQAGVAMVSPANTYSGLTVEAESNEPDVYYPTGERNYTRVVANDNFQGPAAAELAQKLGVTKVLVVNDNSVYGKGLATAFEKAANTLGMEVIANEPYDPKATDYTSFFEQYKDAGVEGVFLGATVDQNAPKVMKDKVAVLGDNEKVKFIGPDGVNNSTFIEESGGAAEGAYLTIAGLPTSEIKEGPGVAIIEELLKEDDKVEPYTIYGVAAAQALLKAIENSDGTRASVVEQLFQVNIPAEESVIGKELRFDENGDVTATDISVSLVEGGEAKFQEVITPTAVG